MNANPLPENTVEFKPQLSIATESPERTRSKFKGLKLRNGIFYTDFRVSGKRYQKCTGYPENKLPAAYKFLEEAKNKVLAGESVFEKQKRVEKVLFGDFMAAAWDNPKAMYPRCTWMQAQVIFGNDAKAKRKLEAELGDSIFSRSVNYATRLKPLLAYFEKMEVRQIKNETVTAYRNARRKAKIDFAGKSKRTEISEACINRETTTLSDFWKRALKSRDFKDKAASFPNPYDSEDHDGDEEDGIKIYWHAAIVEKFIRAANDISSTFSFPVEMFVDICLFLLNTGLRVESALLIKCGQIDLDSGLDGGIQFEAWQLKVKKNSKLSFRYEKAVEIAKKYMKGKKPTDFLFTWDGCHKRVNSGNGIEYGSFKHVYDKVFLKSGISEGGIHAAFRKTYAMNRAIDGTDIKKISRELFHQHLSTTELYVDWDLVEDEQTKRAIQNRDKAKFLDTKEEIGTKIGTNAKSSDGQFLEKQ